MNSKTKSIVIVASEFPPQPGGIGTHAYHLASALCNQGYGVTVVTDQRSDDGNAEALFDKSLAFSVYRIQKRSIRLLMYIKRIAKVYKLLNTTDYVIASGKFSLWNVAFCNLFKKRFTMAVIHGTEVNLPFKVFRQLIKISLKQFDEVVAVSNYTKGLMSHLNIKITVIPNGILLSDWSHKGLIPDKNNLIGNPKLITVGRISERKGQSDVVALLPKLLKAFPELHYHCIGIGANAMSLIAKAKDLGVEDHVSFHGVIDSSKLKHYLKQSDIFIILSKPGAFGDVEGFGIAILEANAMGIPAIGALGSGVEDAISINQSGKLVPLGDAKALTQAIQILLESKHHYVQGAKRWAASHDWEHIVEQYISLLP